MAKAAKIIGGVVITLAALGVLANLKDVKRYVRITMM